MAQVKASVTYTPRPDATPEAEVNVLANVYRFTLDCHAKKEAAEPAPEPDGRDGIKVLDPARHRSPGGCTSGIYGARADRDTKGGG
jgi:hypothetical protein